MFQLLNHTLPDMFEHKFLENNYHSYDARNNDYLRIGFFKLDISKNIIFEHRTTIWNNLSPEIRSIENKNKFKKLIRITLSTKHYFHFTFIQYYLL